MENMYFVAIIIFAVIVAIMTSRFWMMIAEFIGENLGLARFILWLYKKINNCIRGKIKNT